MAPISMAARRPPDLQWPPGRILPFGRRVSVPPSGGLGGDRRGCRDVGASARSSVCTAKYLLKGSRR
jgi:hypothetical protein